VSLEWADGDSANVVWALPLSAAKALLSLSRPLLSRDDEPQEVNERVAGEEEEDAEMKDDNGEEKKERAKLTKDEITAKFEAGDDLFADELPGNVPDAASWRVGRPCDQSEHIIFMRLARTSDQAQDANGDKDLFQKNRQLRKNERKPNIALLNLCN